MADDHFGFLGAEVPKSFTPPAGYEGVHQEGMTWPRQGDKRENTSWISVLQWAHLIAQFRALRFDPNVDVSDVAGSSPFLLSTYLGRRILAVLTNTDLAPYGLMPKSVYDPDQNGIIGLAAGGTGVNASNNEDLRDQLGITAAIDAAVAALVASSGHGHAIADVTGLQGELDALAALLVPPGAELYWPGATPPAGWLEEDGSAILIASYSALASALYCGDGENASAAWGYKATTNVNPGSNRSTAGTYIVLPDARGEFTRGWDHGRGVDSGRSLWAMQLDQMQQITGAIRLHNTTWTSTPTGAFAGPATATGDRGTGGANAMDLNFNSANSSGARTGAETRGRNGARMKIIKY